MSSSWVELFTDGACIGNPGHGAWAYLLRFNGSEKEHAEMVPDTTNNRMELQAIVQGLEALTRRCFVTVYTDSQWCYYGAIGRNKRKAHLDLWTRLDKQKRRHHEVMFNWVRGHNGHPENVRVDKLANRKAREWESIEGACK